MLEAPKMAEMDLKTTTFTMDSLVRISVSILLFIHVFICFGRLCYRIICARLNLFFPPKKNSQTDPTACYWEGKPSHVTFPFPAVAGGL